jgi:hypothetical protein
MIVAAIPDEATVTNAESQPFMLPLFAAVREYR